MPFLELSATQPDTCELTDELIVGSGEQAGWRISSQDLAAKHFVVRMDGEEATVAPCSGQHVVAVNGEQIALNGTRLESGDVVAAGSARFIYMARPGEPRPATAPSSEQEPAHLLDDANGRAYAVNGKVVHLGREIGCHVVVRDPTVSRFHAEIRSEAGGHVLYSTGATGTTVNGRTVASPRLLRPRDRIALGSSSYTYVLGPLPAGVKHAGFEEPADRAVHSRPTLVAARAIELTERAPVPSAHTLRNALILTGAVLAGTLIVWVLL